VAFVFGTEMSGLSNEEVMRCHRVAHIGANPAFSSLNLAAAVQVVAYELRVVAARPARLDPRAERFDPATHEDVEGFFAQLETSIVRSGFLDPHHPRRLMERMRRLFGRARLEREEVNILRGMLAAWDEGPYWKKRD
jgi:tRNA/rRNA methyltransferase